VGDGCYTTVCSGENVCVIGVVTLLYYGLWKAMWCSYLWTTVAVLFCAYFYGEHFHCVLMAVCMLIITLGE
jgi:hypothetical protein